MKVIAKSRNGKMLKIGKEDNDSKWYFLADTVIKFAENIQKGEEVTIKYDQSGGKSTITYITKGEGESQQSKPTSEKEVSTKYTCEDCGISLKDDRYKKCWTCNKKNPTSNYSSSNSQNYPDDKGEIIKREAVAHATSRVMIGLQGHIGTDNINEIFTSVYNLILKLVENK